MLNQTPVKRSPVSLAEMTRNMVSIFKEAADDKGVEMSISIDDRIPPLSFVMPIRLSRY